MFLFLAVQVAINLYATSTVAATGSDAARQAALGGGDPAAIAAADAWLRAQLDDDHIVAIEWSTDGDVVRLFLAVEPPHVMVNSAGPLAANTIERTFEVRIERVQTAA